MSAQLRSRALQHGPGNLAGERSLIFPLEVLAADLDFRAFDCCNTGTILTPVVLFFHQQVQLIQTP